MIVTIHQPQYLPWLGYFDKISRADVFIILDDVQYKKNDWQNRNKIRTSQGWQWLTVPVISNFGQKIMDVKIDHKKNWQKAHFSAIKFNYSQAPHYNDVISGIEELYDHKWDYLADINIAFLEKVIMWLGITTKVVRSSDYEATDESTQRLVDLCLLFKADAYLSGADGGKYLDFDKFEESYIDVKTQDYSHPVYSQLWCENKKENFLSHMAIIDLLFNHGKNSLAILRNEYN